MPQNILPKSALFAMPFVIYNNTASYHICDRDLLCGSKFFPFRVDPFSDGPDVRESNTGNHNGHLSCKHVENPTNESSPLIDNGSFRLAQE